MISKVKNFRDISLSCESYSSEEDKSRIKEHDKEKIINKKENIEDNINNVF